MFATSSIELSTSALRNNLRFIRGRMNEGVRLCSVVKGNAYGHGINEFVGMAMKEGVDYFAVHSAEEAYQLHLGIRNLPDLFIMGELEKNSVEWAVEHGIQFSVFDMGRFEEAVNSAKRLGKQARIHIEAETGMRRTGFEMKQISQLCDQLKKHRLNIVLEGLFTHYAGAENQANHFRISKQIENFNKTHTAFLNEGLKPVYHHSACSAALLNYPESQGNLVRVGILQYGFWPNKETHIRFCEETQSNPNHLMRMIRWTSRVMAVKEVAKGNFIGYGTSYLAHKNMRIAILPLGYSHGYSRNLSNAGSVLINGKSANVVGTVNMNSITVDVTKCGDIKIGDEVVLIGTQNGNAVTVSSFSEQSQQLNYELLTRLPCTIPRIVKK